MTKTLFKMECIGYSIDASRQCFRKGWTWPDGDTDTKGGGAFKYLFLSSAGIMTYSKNEDTFNAHSCKEITRHDVPRYVSGCDPEEMLPKDNERKWMFHVNAEYQIDFNRIVEDLTAEKPIALIRTPKTTYGLVRGSLVGKMVHSENFEVLRTELVECTEREGVLPKAVVYIVKQENLGKFFKLWRDVKAGRHAKEHRHGKQEVIVSLQSL